MSDYEGHIPKNAAISFADTKIVEEEEAERKKAFEGREAIEKGDEFIIYSILFAPTRKFKEMTYINGVDMEGNPIKKYTTAKVLFSRLEKMAKKFGRDGELNTAIHVKVDEVESKDGYKYLTFV